MNNDNEELLITVQHELQLIRDEKTKGNIIRLRIYWIENGETPTNFICNLEKYNNTYKTIPFLETVDGKW